MSVLLHAVVDNGFILLQVPGEGCWMHTALWSSQSNNTYTEALISLRFIKHVKGIDEGKFGSLFPSCFKWWLLPFSIPVLTAQIVISCQTENFKHIQKRFIFVWLRCRISYRFLQLVMLRGGLKSCSPKTYNCVDRFSTHWHLWSSVWEVSSSPRDEVWISVLLS